jgi:hypothetical protein
MALVIVVVEATISYATSPLGVHKGLPSSFEALLLIAEICILLKECFDL